MNVALTIWGKRISPVFDSAQTLLVANVCQERVTERQTLRFQAAIFNRCLVLLQELDVRVFICGALCEGPVRLLEFHGIEVIPFIAGEADEILRCYAAGSDLKEFAMPGCGHARCCRQRADRQLSEELKMKG